MLQSSRSDPVYCQISVRTLAPPAATLTTLLMYSASEPTLFNFGCMIRLSSLPASVHGSILSIKFSQCFSSVTARCVHDQEQRSVLDATHNDCVQLEVCFLPLIVRREVTQQVWRCSSRHIVSHVSEAWVNSCDVRDELESPLVVTPFLCTIEARRFSQVSRIQSHHCPRSRIVSWLRHHIEMGQ